MKAAVVTEPGKTPVYTDFSQPIAAQGENHIIVTASALSRITKVRAAGTHYSSSGNFPFVAGFDGVGKLADGTRVFFLQPNPPFGGMAQETVVKASLCLPLPDELDDVTAAAITNPGTSSWTALKKRAKLIQGETVLVNGATGTSGRLAVQIAKYLGAGKVIATGRNVEVLKELERLGADVTIQLTEDGVAFEDAIKDQFGSDKGIDIVLDYLWGQSAERILTAGAKYGRAGVPMRFIHNGDTSGTDITLSGPVLRSSAIEILGNGLGSIAFPQLLKAMGEVLQATVPGGFEVATKVVPLSEVEQNWSNSTAVPRTVFVPRL